jgi:tetratricopeptide (TPR) repeat protein
MRRACLALAAAGALFGAPALAAPVVTSPVIEPGASAAGAGDADVKAVAEHIADAMEKAQHRDASSVLGEMAPLVSTPAYSRLYPSDQAFGLFLLAWAAYTLKDFATAHSAAVQSTDMDPGNDQAWIIRVGSAAKLAEWDDEDLSLTTVARQRPAVLASILDATIFSLNSQPAGPRRTTVLLALHDAHWAPKDPTSSTDVLWFTLATDLLSQGDLEHAKLVARDISGYRELIAMHADRRYDAIVSADPATFDVSAALDRELARRRADAAASPTKLAPVNALAFALVERNKPDEALAVVQAALAKTHASGTGKPYFDDQDAHLDYTLDDESRALLDLGRADEAIKVQEQSAAITELGGANVNQVLNLASFLADLARPRDALKTLRDFDPSRASPYGTMVWRQDLVCAYAQAGDTRSMSASLDYLKAHAGDGPLVLQYALACAGDADGYAKALIAGLDDPETRATVLLRLQDFLPSPVKRSAWHDSRQAFERSAKQRPDVQAAIVKYGRIASYPVNPDF